MEDIKFDIIVRALGAENVPAAPGTTIGFAWSLDDNVETTQVEKTEMDGFVEWDATCKMRCGVPEGEQQYLSEFKLYSVTEDQQVTEGNLVCEAAIDIRELCMAGPTPTHYTIDLYPAGRLHLSICSHQDRPQQHVDAEADGYLSAATEGYVSTLNGELSGLDGMEALSVKEVEELQVDERNLKVDTSKKNTDVVDETPSSRHTDTGSFQSWLDRGSDGAGSLGVPSVSSASEGRTATPAAGSEATSHMLSEERYDTPMSAFIDNGDVQGLAGDPVTVVKTLRKKCQRLTQAREEARAESFAQASIAVQRGIEIDNLKRAKEMLLQRLETAELELLASCQRAGDNDSGSPADNDTELLSALVATKVELAQKDYAIMELQGTLRHAEANIESLKHQLEAALQANTALKETQSSHWWSMVPTPTALRSVINSPVVGKETNGIMSRTVSDGSASLTDTEAGDDRDDAFSAHSSPRYGSVKDSSNTINIQATTSTAVL